MAHRESLAASTFASPDNPNIDVHCHAYAQEKNYGEATYCSYSYPHA